MELKRVLKLPAVVFIAVGFAVGGGVFVLTGIVYEMTGPALPLAYALAAVPVFISMLPLAMLASAIPATGASYVYPSRMVSPAVAFVGIWVYALASFFGQIPLWALGCARYIQPYAPGLPPAGVALALVTFFFLVNYRGVEPAVQLQAVFVVILILALLVYAATGLAAVSFDPMAVLHTRGAGKLLLGTALLTFTYFGPNGIIELGGEIVKPGRVIPRAFGISFLVTAVIYVAVAAATAAVLGAGLLPPLPPGEEPLIHVSRLTGGAAGSAFFVFGGAVLALTTTLNALFLVGTRALLRLAEDGLLPASLAVLHPRFGTPYRLLTLVWGLSAAGILLGLSLETLASYSALGAMIIFLPLMIAALRLPRLYPAHYRRSEFKLRGFWLWFCPAVGIAMVLFFGAVILVELDAAWKILGFSGFIASGIVIYALRRRTLRSAGPQGRPFPDMEDNPDG
jgi:APA family basic amino acid/polyamine antiporter